MLRHIFNPVEMYVHFAYQYITLQYLMLIKLVFLRYDKIFSETDFRNHIQC